MPHDELMKIVKEFISDHNDKTMFRTNSGIPTEDFLDILSFYLKCTFIGWQDHVYAQRTGVWLGPRVAPMLSKMFLGIVCRQLLGVHSEGRIQ